MIVVIVEWQTHVYTYKADPLIIITATCNISVRGAMPHSGSGCGNTTERRPDTQHDMNRIDLCGSGSGGRTGGSGGPVVEKNKYYLNLDLSFSINHSISVDVKLHFAGNRQIRIRYQAIRFYGYQRQISDGAERDRVKIY